MRLLIVSNRLPVTAVSEAGRITFTESAGGLVSGLSAYLDSLKSSPFVQSSSLWLGWPGISVRDEDRDEVQRSLGEACHARAVFASESSMDAFYLGFCNGTIWPLFHYFQPFAAYEPSTWDAYVRVNEAFRDAVLDVVEEGDIIWVHDYHLMLLPKLLRERLPNAQIGFFLHIPFPSVELFQLLPREWRSALLDGLLGSDVVGFHTAEYTQHFLHSVARVVGLEAEKGRIAVGGRIVRADTFPMGIHFAKYNSAATCEEVVAARQDLVSTLRERKLILSIDRLDYSKGTVNRLLAYEQFLQKYPEWRSRVVLALVVVPSRVGVQDYQRTKLAIDELVGRINGGFGDLTWTPILYQYRFLPFVPLLALYTASDVALVTPLRDGMNLIAKEYVASRADGSGVLILSELAGAAKEMEEALIVNPNDIGEMADALKYALEMPVEEQRERNSAMQSRLRHYDVIRWADEFVRGVGRVRQEQR